MQTFPVMYFCNEFLFFLAVSCGLPNFPANANINATDLLSGSEAMIMCNEGFQISPGNNAYTITCQPNGDWTSATFTCDGKLN